MAQNDPPQTPNSRTQTMGKLVFRKSSHSRRAARRLVKGQACEALFCGTVVSCPSTLPECPSSRRGTRQDQAHTYAALGSACYRLQPHQFSQQGEEEKLLSSPGSLSCSVLHLLHAGLFRRHLKSPPVSFPLPRTCQTPASYNFSDFPPKFLVAARPSLKDKRKKAQGATQQNTHAGG